MSVGKDGFRMLKVWQKGKNLAVMIYGVTNTGQFQKDFGLREQIRRAAVSIPSNIAEGDERDTDRDAVRCFFIAKGSVAEVLTQAIIALEIGYLDSATFATIENECLEISKMLARLITARTKTFS